MLESLIDYYIRAKNSLAKKPYVANIAKSLGGLALSMQLIVPSANPLNLAWNVSQYFDNFASAQVADPSYPNTFPESVAVPRKTMKVPVTGYNSLPGQTDSTPCSTANGFDLCLHNQEDVIAANFLPFGTKVKFPELYGDKIFTVQDRMNARYYYHADIWMKSFPDAKKFGMKYTTIEIY